MWHATLFDRSRKAIHSRKSAVACSSRKAYSLFKDRGQVRDERRRATLMQAFNVAACLSAPCRRQLDRIGIDSPVSHGDGKRSAYDPLLSDGGYTTGADRGPLRRGIGAWRCCCVTCKAEQHEKWIRELSSGVWKLRIRKQFAVHRSDRKLTPIAVKRN